MKKETYYNDYNNTLRRLSVPPGLRLAQEKIVVVGGGGGGRDIRRLVVRPLEDAPVVLLLLMPAHDLPRANDGAV